MLMAKRKPPAVHSDFGPREATQPSHGPVRIDRVAEEGTSERDRVRRNLTAPLEYYRGQRIISNNQYLAGAALRRLYVRAHAEPALTPQYAERIGEGSVQDAHTSRRTIMQKYNEALWHIGPRDAVAVRTACCEELYLPSKVDREKLKQGLSKLHAWLERGAPGRPKKRI